MTMLMSLEWWLDLTFKYTRPRGTCQLEKESIILPQNPISNRPTSELDDNNYEDLDDESWDDEKTVQKI